MIANASMVFHAGGRTVASMGNRSSGRRRGRRVFLNQITTYPLTNSLTSSQSKSLPQTPALRPPPPETPPTAAEYPYTDFEPRQSSPAPSPPRSPPQGTLHENL